MGGIASASDYLAEITAILGSAWPNNRTVNIVCHGHSGPAGYFDTPNVRTFDSYPHLLHAALKERFSNAVINVIVTAIGGENSAAGSARFERDVLPHRPDLLTIDYALNDRSIGLERATAAWSSMIEKATRAGIKVILLTPTGDTRSDMLDAGDPLVQHAELVRSLARRYHVGLADPFKVFQERIRSGTELSSLMSHVNHPNRAGHEIIVKELLKWFH